MRIKVSAKIAIHNLSVNLLQNVECQQSNNIKKLVIHYKSS